MLRTGMIGLLYTVLRNGVIRKSLKFLLPKAQM